MTRFGDTKFEDDDILFLVLAFRLDEVIVFC